MTVKNAMEDCDGLIIQSSTWMEARNADVGGEILALIPSRHVTSFGKDVLATQTMSQTQASTFE
jgi:hypothetical protein